MKKVNLHISRSSFKYESRILKETKSLVDSGLVDKVFIGAVWESGVKQCEELDRKREILRLPLKSGALPSEFLGKILAHVEWALKIFCRFKNESIKVVHCHSLPALPIGVLFKIVLKSRIVYDAHELETEKGWGSVRRILSKVLEMFLIYYADVIIVVGDSIAEWYKSKYNLDKVYVIKNLPVQENNEIEDHNILRKTFNIQDNEILYIYQGALSNGRGIEILLNAFSKVNRKKHVVFMGYGELEDTIKRYENRFSNIHLKSAVKPEEIIAYTQSADVGISLIENICLSYFYSLPNKVFEYILSGLAIIVSDFPDMGKIIDDNECGWKVSVNEKALIDLIENMSSEDIKEKKNNALNCRDSFHWHREEEKLLKIYDKLDRYGMKRP